MTQTAPQPAPAPQPGAAPAAGPPATAAHASVVPASSAFSEDVPSLLNRLQALAVAACLVFGVLAAVVQVMSSQANGRAADNTEQVVRVQQVQSLLLRADALATNSYLVGGLEPADARAAYNEAIDGTLRLIADAAEAQPADRAVLADLNAAVTTYTTAVTQARDYNRQQYPIGIAYLNSAGTSLRAEALPIVQALVDANAERATDEMDGQHPLWLLALGLLALGVLYWVNRQLARRFHRRLNVGIAAAGVVVAVLTVVVSAHAVAKGSDNDGLRDGAYTMAVDEASARTAANDAKARESQGLINRGSGASVYEPLFAAQAEIVGDNASGSTLRLWEQYLAAHDQVRALDDDGDWSAAVDLATATGDTDPTTLLDQVDATSAATVDRAGAEAVDGFRGGTLLSLLLVVITALGALAAAVAATRGIDVRRREYS